MKTWVILLAALLALTLAACHRNAEGANEYMDEIKLVKSECKGDTLAVTLAVDAHVDDKLVDVPQERLIPDHPLCGGKGEPEPEPEATEDVGVAPEGQEMIDEATASEPPVDNSGAQLHIHCSKPKCMVILEGVE